MKTKPRLVAIALSATLILTSALPARSNAIVVGDLVLVGTVVTAGVLYYVWQNKKTHKKIYTIEDPEAESRRLGGHHQTEPVTAGTRAKAEALCHKFARGRKLKQVKHFRDNQWECIYY